MAKKFLVTMSDELFRAMELRRKKLKVYRSPSELVNGLVRYDCEVQKEHYVSGNYASLSPSERDHLDAAILEQVESGKGIRGSWLEKRIKEAVAKVSQETGREPTKEEVLQELRAGK